MGTVVNFVIYNATINKWLQDDEKSWGHWDSKAIFTDAKLAEDIRVRQTRVTYALPKSRPSKTFVLTLSIGG